MNENEALKIILSAIFNALDDDTKNQAVKKIKQELKILNRDIKTVGSNGAIIVANVAERITGDKDYKLGNGFD
jgi:hypothetical protein